MTAQPTAPSTVHPRSVTLPGLASALDEAAASRHDQLERLQAAGHDPVGDAQQAGLRQTLSEIDRARARIEAGTFGVCTVCRRPISLPRLEFRPWSANCVGCASR